MQSHIAHHSGLPSYSSIDHGRTVRPVSTSLLTIDSEDRFPNYATQQAASVGGYNADPYNFTITKTESLVAVPPTRIAVTEVVFPWAISNVNKKTNQILVTLKAFGNNTLTTVPVTLASQFLKPSELAAAIQQIVRTAFPTQVPAFTMSYGFSNQPIFVYNTNVFDYSIAFSPVPYNTATYPYSSATKQLFNLLGMTPYNTPTNPVFLSDALSDSNVGTGLTFCQFTRYIDIVCQQLTGLQGIRDTTSQPIVRDALCRIYIANPSDVSNVDVSGASFCPPGCAPFTIYRDFATPKQIQWIPNQPVAGGLTFSVYSDDGELLSSSSAYETGSLYGNSTNWSMTMLCTEN